MTDGPTRGQGRWYWCLTHAQVEQGPGCPDMERLGPYDSRERAEGAIARTRARTEEQDAADERWREQS